MRIWSCLASCLKSQELHSLLQLSECRQRPRQARAPGVRRFVAELAATGSRAQTRPCCGPPVPPQFLPPPPLSGCAAWGGEAPPPGVGAPGPPSANSRPLRPPIIIAHGLLAQPLVGLTSSGVPALPCPARPAPTHPMWPLRDGPWGGSPTVGHGRSHRAPRQLWLNRVKCPLSSR